MPPTLTRIGALLFLSGLCSLVYQVVWLRSLRMVFGSSTPATAVVLAIFMGGLGLGGWIFGRRAERHGNPLSLYAGLEFGIALAAAASLVLIGLTRELYLWLGGSSSLGLVGATALRIALTAVVLALPTILMGGTLPAVAQAMERHSDRGRRIVASLYGINTLGAVGGAFLTTFFLIELVGVQRSLWLACLVNLLIALVARSWARAMDQHGALPTEGREAFCDPPEDPRPGFPAVLLLVIAGLTGFLFFLMELVWYRMLAPLLGGSSYTFGLILALALAGIGCGGGLYALGSPSRRPHIGGLALSLTLQAFFLALPFALGDRLTFFASILRGLEGGGFFSLVVGWTLVAGFVVFPCALVAGYQFPLLVALLGSGRRSVGSEVGRAYAWNTWGAVLGSLMGGFVLLPAFTAPHLWRVSILTLAGLGMAVAFLEAVPFGRQASMRSRALTTTISCGLLSFALAATQGPSAFWRHTAVGAGRAEIHPQDPNDLKREIHQARRSLLTEAEGVESSVALMIRGELSLYVNGKSDGSMRGDAPMQIMGGLVGGLIHPQPRNVLVIGLGTGMTAGWLAQIETVEKVDAVELEPAVAEFSHDFAAATFDVLNLPNVRLHYGDGREFMRTTDARYDIIFSEPSNPYRAGVADLFSQEFYQAVADRLEPGGVFLHWLQGYEVDVEAVRIVYSTLASVFPHVESWQVHSSDLLLVGSKGPLIHDFDAIRERVTREPFRSGLNKTWLVDGIEGFYSAFVGNTRLTEALANPEGTGQSTEISRDDRPAIEFSFARNMGRRNLFKVSDLQILSRQVNADRPAGHPDRSPVGTAIDWQRVEELRQVRTAAGNFSGSSGSGNSGSGNSGSDDSDSGKRRREARWAYRNKDLAAAAALWFSQNAPPMALFDRFLIAESLAERADPQTADALADLRPLAATDATLIEARLAWRQGDLEAATDHLERAFKALRVDPWAFRPIIERGLELSSQVITADPSRIPRLFKALEEPFAGYMLEEVRRLKRLEMAYLGDFETLCVSALAAFEPHVIWEEGFLIYRADCYEKTGHALKSRARRELEAYLRKAAPRLDLDGVKPEFMHLAPSGERKAAP